LTAQVETATGTGRVARIIGPVVDAEFPADAMPEIFNALQVEVTFGDEPKILTLEVAQHLGDNMVRAISMQPTDGLVRGAVVTDTGRQISVPVGDVVKGHVWNALGESLDVPTASLEITERRGIHGSPPPFDQLESKTEMLETGIKVIDLLTPYVQGGKIGLFGGAGVGKTVLIQEMITRVARISVAPPASPVSASAPVRATTSGWRWTRPTSSRTRPWSSARWTSRRARVFASPCPP